jgi:hypothetical protein
MMSKVASVWELFSLKYVTSVVKFTEFNEGGTLRIIVSCKLRLENKQTAKNDSTDYFLRGLEWGHPSMLAAWLLHTL